MIYMVVNLKKRKYNGKLNFSKYLIYHNKNTKTKKTNVNK